ncbi:DUF6647 family protein [uncultured Roseobacter sp.]|uniref:DUF6647 family protein n=1 Tax=uncultured Roseobacter sp. TaxID=114847 RepID=UPI00262BAFC6|nr:DUF6647 family protein [uncultured Roseobacter sp.]
MDTFLTVVVTWLAINFGLPVNFEHPEVKLIGQNEMIELRIAALDDEDAVKFRRTVEQGHSIIAFYDDPTRTIYLPEGWSAESPADVSVLVHEMVHHLQNVAEIPQDCPEGRELPAYHAQERWLQQVGTTLEQEFELDAMTLHFLTKCWHGPP